MPTPETIKALRQELGLTLAAFGELIGVSESTVCRWELGLSHPRYGMMKKLNELAAKQAETAAAAS